MALNASGCPKCGGRMEEGFILDYTHGAGRVPSSWVEGRPQRGFWGRAKLWGKVQVPVRAFRCVGCGFLESYAEENDMTDNQDREEEISEKEMPDESDVNDGADESGSYPCPFCGKDVYEDAVKCPHCGKYVSPEDAKAYHPWQRLVLLLLLAMGGLLVWALVR